MHMNITSAAAANPYAAPAQVISAAFRRPGIGRPGIRRTLVTGNDIDPNGPAGPQPSRADKRWYFALMTTCIGLFVLVLGGD